MRKALYRILALVTRYGELIRRRFTPAGQLVLGATIAAAVVGVDTNQTLAYQLFTFLFVALLVAMLQGWLFSPKLELHRRLPRYATAGQPFEYRVRIRNSARHREEGLSLLENTRDPRPSFDQFRLALARKSHAKGWLRRLSIWDRWQRLIRLNQAARLEELPLPGLAPEETLELRCAVTPLRRGTIDLEGLTVARADRFGLFKAFKRYPQRDSMLVLPRRYGIAPLTLPGGRVYQHGGMTLASSVGDSEEFVGLRDYRPGDPLKHIHWKSFARTGSVVVREYQDEFFERHALILDTFSDQVTDAAFEEAVSVAASFAAGIDTQESLLDLLFVGNESYCFTAGRGQLSSANMLEILAHVQPSKAASFEALHDSVIARRGLLSSCILVLLDWDEPRKHLSRTLQACGLPIKILVVHEDLEGDDSEPALTLIRPGHAGDKLLQL